MDFRQEETNLTSKLKMQDPIQIGKETVKNPYLQTI
jgi:hypothetical protein